MVIPTLSTYVAAVGAFVSAYPQIKIIAPWGEPDFQPGGSEPKFAIGHAGGANFGQASCPAKPTLHNCGPKLAAQMWVAVRHRCPSCTVIAGDFGGNPGQDAKYLSEYRKYLRDISGGHQVYHPAVWGIHPYADVEKAEQEIQDSGRVTTPLRDTLVASYASWLKADGYGANTRIWLDEISSFTYSSSTSGCRAQNDCYSLQVQAAGGRYLFGTLLRAPSAGEPKVTRIYYMRFAGDTPDSLVKGTPRPIYDVVASRPKTAAIAQDAVPSPAPASSGGQAKPKASVTAAPTSPAGAVPASAARYEVRDHADGLCLDANSLGPTAGQNGDVVQLWNCYGAANQKWIPVYKSGKLGWLENAKYPGMCLNANNIGGLANGRKVQLWNCYIAGNELWNLGTLLANPASSPVFLGTGGSQSLALDANKYDLGNGDKVQIWAYYGGSSQLWSAVSA